MIKYYKGINAVTKKWIHGFYLEDEKKNGYIGVYLPYNRSLYVGGRGFEKRIKQYLGVGLIVIEKNSQCIETGLNDKNGNRIFENDIVTLFGEKYVVIWERNRCAFVIVNKKSETTNITDFPNDYYEIIGNIKDNLEVLND